MQTYTESAWRPIALQTYSEVARPHGTSKRDLDDYFGPCRDPMSLYGTI